MRKLNKFLTYILIMSMLFLLFACTILIVGKADRVNQTNTDNVKIDSINVLNQRYENKRVK